MLKVQKSPSHQLSRIAWEASKKIQTTHKTCDLNLVLHEETITHIWTFEMVKLANGLTMMLHQHTMRIPTYSSAPMRWFDKGANP